MAVEVNKAELAILQGLKALRENTGVKLKDLARELGMSQGQLSMHESGIRGFNTYSLEAFVEDYECSVEKIAKFNSEYEVDRDGLLWKKVTDERLTTARQLHSQGQNISKISIQLGVDEFKLNKLMFGEEVNVYVDEDEF